MTANTRPFGLISEARGHMSPTYFWPVMMDREAFEAAVRFFRGEAAEVPAFQSRVWFRTRRTATAFAGIVNQRVGRWAAIAP